MLRNNACLTSHPYNACKLHTCILLLLPLSAYKNMTLTTLICKVRVLSLTAIKDACDDIVRFVFNGLIQNINHCAFAKN